MRTIYFCAVTTLAAGFLGLSVARPQPAATVTDRHMDPLLREARELWRATRAEAPGRGHHERIDYVQRFLTTAENARLAIETHSRREDVQRALAAMNRAWLHVTHELNLLPPGERANRLRRLAQRVDAVYAGVYGRLGVLEARPQVIVPSAAVQNDAALLQGTWTQTYYEAQGQQIIPPKVMKKVFDNGKFYVLSGDEEVQEGTYQINPSAQPKAIDLVFSFITSDQPGAVYRGIYQLTNDTYTECIGASGGDRPVNFVTQPGSPAQITIWKRDRR